MIIRSTYANLYNNSLLKLINRSIETTAASFLLFQSMSVFICIICNTKEDLVYRVAHGAACYPRLVRISTRLSS